MKKAIAVATLAVAAVILSGAALRDDAPNAVLVEEVYTVKPGDTVWSIAEEYLPKNTYSRRYILEYIDGMRENNPQIVGHEGEIQPGDVLKMTYWVKRGEENENGSH